MSEAFSKAAGFNSTIKTLRDLVAQDKYDKFVRSLAFDTRQLVDKPPMAVAWLPIKHWMNMIDTAHWVCFGGSDEQVKELGRRSTRDDLNRLYRFAVRLASPQYIIDKAGALWTTYTKDNGTVRVNVTSKNTVDVIYADVEAAQVAAFWPFQAGSILGILELTGVKEPAVTALRSGPRDGMLKAQWK